MGFWRTFTNQPDDTAIPEEAEMGQGTPDARLSLSFLMANSRYASATAADALTLSPDTRSSGMIPSELLDKARALMASSGLGDAGNGADTEGMPAINGESTSRSSSAKKKKKRRTYTEGIASSAANAHLYRRHWRKQMKKREEEANRPPDQKPPPPPARRR